MHGEQLVTLTPAAPLKKIPADYPRAPRLVYDRPPGGLPAIHTPREMYQYLCTACTEALSDPREHAYVLALTTKYRLLTPPYLLAIGQMDLAEMDRREILRYVLLAGGTHFALMHTHPSGDPTPSVPDKQMTELVRAAGETLDLQLLDHLILGGCHRDEVEPRYYSFKEGGLL